MLIGSIEHLVAIIVINLLSVSLTVQQDAKPETTFAKSEPIIDPQDGYITKFIAHGFDVTKINLFGNLQLENLKATIFEYEPKDKDTVCSSDAKYCYTFMDSLAFITVLESKRTETTVYRLERALHPLLNPNVSDQTAGNYSYQLNESSYYGRVSAESYWKLKLANFSHGFFDAEIKQKFKDDVKNLVGKNISEYFKFIVQYGTHYFKEVTFGGMYRMEGKANDRFVEDISEDSYKAYLEGNIQRATGVNVDVNNLSIPLSFYYHNHYDNFTYGGDSNQIDFENWQKTIESNIVPIDWTKDTIYNLIRDISKFLHKNVTVVTVIVENLKLATETIETKYKIKSYLEGLKVIQNNLYGRKIGGKCNPYSIQKYFEEKLYETYPVLDQTFMDNCWCVEHDAESILNRRSWFIRPLPTEEPPFS